jgi:recombinational DNA repair ATPase RecF
MNHSLLLYNWRCFRSSAFELPSTSFALIDNNGAGKSSLLSAIYSLYTGRSWPGVKITENMTAGQQYFGVLTDRPDWSFSGQIGTNSRVSTRYQHPTCLDDKSTVWPTIFTYSPDDNYWLSLPRNLKLAQLDLLIGCINTDYLDIVAKLDKYVRAKQKALRSKSFTDFRMIAVITRAIHDLSVILWNIRYNYLTYIEQLLPEFASWIQSSLQSWHVAYEISDIQGIKRKYNKNLINTQLSDEQIEYLWKKEQIIGKIMYGAQRDEFQVESNGIRAQKSLSRGENRLLVLYIKYLTQKKVLELTPTAQIWWLLDDVYNELDTKREDILQREILDFAHFSIYSGTRTPDGDIEVFAVKDLMIGG